MQFTKRAEGANIDTLVDTFVDAGPLLTLLHTVDHQVLYGRRGTGKTHALLFLAEQVREAGNWGVYVDLRQIGSSGGLYGDSSLPISERGTRLLIDVLAAIHSELVTLVLEASESQDFDFTQAFGALDRLADSITEVEVKGTVEFEEEMTRSSSSNSGFNVEISASSLGAGVTAESTEADGTRVSVRRQGTEHHHIHFGSVGSSLRALSTALGQRHVWLLLDEWSTIPLELQPILADLLRRTLFAVQGFTVKIAAIEHRSRFRQPRPDGDYLGIEVGADASANVDLDDFMVFGNNADQAQVFFQHLLFRHARAGHDPSKEVASSLVNEDAFISAAFTQQGTFDELVRAAEGVPRDAINVVALAAQLAGSDLISINHIRDAARRWYQRDKEAALVSNTETEQLLHWIVDRVIGDKRTKGFLLDPAGIHDENVRALYDSRVLHLIRRGISSRDFPGVRFNAYSLDYGCYVHLTAARAPRSLFQAEDDSGLVDVQVPTDDYRSIRTAVLNLAKFYQPAV